VKDLKVAPHTVDCGRLDAKIRISRYPDAPGPTRLGVQRRIALRRDRDNALYVCATLADGHQAWSSPIYLIAK
jgi:hypothetical protein